ncbi:hypothetical protein QOZ80_5AG0378750 [Eleusine coracana subsp. coracana]|nr:hypothetical protein QOZ80_5AG0378750 [Eleusine coracana subsp. coracana]
MAHPSSLRQALLLVLLSSMESATTRAAVGGEGEFVYDGFSSSDLTVDGDASVAADGLLRLTSGRAVMKGHAFYPYPLIANSTNLAVPNGASVVPSFSTTFVFSIMGPYLGVSSHGLAFVLSLTKNFSNALPSQYLGLVNGENHGNRSNHLLAIELDTVKSTEFEDIDSNHVGIDINGLISFASSSAKYYNNASSDGSFVSLDLATGQPIQMWVDYDSKEFTLNVTISPCCSSSSSSNNKPSKPLLSVLCDVSLIFRDVQVSTVYAGFSSSTGDLSSRHYVLGWSFKVNGEAAALNYSALSLKNIQELAQQIPSPPRHNKKLLFAVLVPITLVMIVLVSAVLVKIHMKRRSQEQEWDREYGPPSFSYKDLVAATSGFKDKMLLGRGGFGSVFRGVLPHSKQTVAIKRVSPESKQGMKEFMAEIVILGHLRHRNLVQLLGYCRHKQQLLLVYDYMPNRSLDCYLHSQHNNTGSNNLINWTQRFRIIKGVASGLLYLHEEWEQVIIHRDIKSSNVLLDAEMNARLGDFGLARSHDHGADAHTTRMAGTWGYIAPELARLGKATKATDVFAFGVLMMELVCARRPIWVNAADGEPLALADWVIAAWRGGSIITNVVDPRLLPTIVDDDDKAAQEAELVLKLGLLCSHPWPNARPCMRLVMQYLQRDAPLPDDLHPDSLMSSDVLNHQNNNNEQHAVSCPFTTITDLSKGSCYAKEAVQEYEAQNKARESYGEEGS